jgi:hypothetical protein
MGVLMKRSCLLAVERVCFAAAPSIREPESGNFPYAKGGEILVRRHE